MSGLSAQSLACANARGKSCHWPKLAIYSFGGQPFFKEYEAAKGPANARPVDSAQSLGILKQVGVMKVLHSGSLATVNGLGVKKVQSPCGEVASHDEQL